MIPTAEEVIKRSKIHPVRVKNIYVFGTVWEICIRNRSLGYQGLYEEFPNVNILVNPDYILKLDATVPDIKVIIPLLSSTPFPSC